jgi:hypothetical protein
LYFRRFDTGIKRTDPSHSFCLLRARHHRPRCRAAERRYERAPVRSTDRHQILSP